MEGIIMIDVIIPAYNAHKTMARLLGSIVMQVNVEDLNVVIVNDASDRDYSEFVTAFSPFVKIKEVKMEKNGGPGTARRVGMENSSSEYLTFIDADDTFFDAYSLKNLHKAITENNKDCIISTFVEEVRDEKGETKFVPHPSDMVWVFGKMYRRAFLEKYNLKFNDTRANEDNGFNTAVSLLSDKVALLENVATYYWHWTETSITRNNDYAFNGMEGFIDNQIWALDIVLKNEHNNELCIDKMLKNLIMLYFYMCQFVGTGRDMKKYFKWCKNYYEHAYKRVCADLPPERIMKAYIETLNGTDVMKTVVPIITYGQFISILEGKGNLEQYGIK